MNGKELKRIRERYGWTQKQLAELINEGTERKYRPNDISTWERRPNDVPDAAAAFLEALDGDHEPPVSAASTPLDDSEGGFIDDAPGGDGPAPLSAQTPLALTSLYAKTCEQFFEMIAMAVGMIGAAVGNDTLRRDGQIIEADKKALGAAWGRLAETNEVFRNIIMSADKQGAYLAVALTTGTTAGKLWQNHQHANPPKGTLHVVPADQAPPAPA